MRINMRHCISDTRSVQKVYDGLLGEGLQPVMAGVISASFFHTEVKERKKIFRQIFVSPSRKWNILFA